MKHVSYIKHFLLISQTVILLLMIPSCSRDESSQDKSDLITIGTGAIGGNYDIVGRAVAKIVNNKQDGYGLRIEDINTSGSTSNIDAIMASEIELGIAQADRQYQAFNGLAEWAERGPQKDLRSIFSLHTEAVTLVAGRDSEVKTLHDLKGKRIDIGLPGSGTKQNAIDALVVAGIDWKKDIEAYEEELDVRLSMLMHNRIDAFFHTVGHPSQDIRFAALSVRGIRFIPLVNIEKILSTHHYYSKSSIPLELYPLADNEKDVETIGVKATLLTSAKVPDNIVYAVTKAVFEDLELLAEYAPIMKTGRKESMLEGLTAPIHSGALKYYQEAGLKIPSSEH